MAPKIRPVKNTGADIRAFFGGAGSTGGSQPKSQSSRNEPIEINDSDDNNPTLSRPIKAPSPGKPQAAPSSSARSLKRKQAIISSDDEAPPPKQPSVPKASTSASTKRKKAIVTSDEDEESAAPPPPKKKSATSSSSVPKSFSRASNSKSKKRINKDYDEDEQDDVNNDDDDDFIASDDEDDKPKKKKSALRKPAGKSASKSTPQKEQEQAVVKDKSEEEKPKAKFNWAAAKAAKLAGPSNPGSKAIPEPAAPDCLAGLTFVFTGQLNSLAREEAIDLAKRFGGRVTGQPSSKTSFVVVGEDAGQSKLTALKKNNVPMLNEDEFLHLIATRKGPGAVDEKTKKKEEKERKDMEKAAREMEAREKEQARAAKTGVGAKGKGKSKVIGTVKADPATQLWTDRYAPQSLKEICGNKGQIEKLIDWLHAWPESVKCGFKKPGKNGTNIFRGVLISGPPGIGKTTSAHLCAKMAGFVPIELNASDVRSKKLVENSMNITNTSLDGWMGGGETTNVAGVTITDKSCLIMDEVDGMSAGDRGGVGALSAMIKKTKIPIICIANDRSLQKMKPLVNVTYNMSFRKPEAQAIRSRIMTVAFKEKMKIPANVVDQLVTGVNSDIRQVLNMLSTWKLRSDTMGFDEGKTLAKMNEKYAVMTPFNIIHDILGPVMWERTSRKTLNDKMDMYFQDYSFVPLFMQENYLKTYPSLARNLDGPDKQMKELELMDNASTSLSDGDLVDALIHGSEQHWTLMPTHAVLSTVRPASFMHGPGGGYGSPNAMSFPQWLGQNSKQNKLSRQLGELQVHMRLNVSGDKSQIREAYIPALYPHLVQPLAEGGASAVDKIIEMMDGYYISREDWDSIVELGVGDYKDEIVLKKISTATKTAFTRKYNAKDHPIAFHKAETLGKMPKKLLDGGLTPDLEEAFDVDEEVPDEDDEKKEVDPDDIAGDKLIVDKAAKAKQKATAGGSTKGANPKGKGKKS